LLLCKSAGLLLVPSGIQLQRFRELDESTGDFFPWHAICARSGFACEVSVPVCASQQELRG
jgi:hypothetical protein